MRTILLSLVLIGTTFVWSTSAQCAQNLVEFTPNGTCATYPATGLCGPLLGGQQVFLGAGASFQLLDTIAATLLKTLEANRGIVDNECRIAGDSLVCNSVYQGCRNQAPNLNEGIPVLPCRSFCEAFWGKCQAAFDAFFVGAIQALNQPKESFSFPHCGPQGTWTLAPQDADTFGNRSIPGLGPFPLGYNKQLRFPEVSASYKRLDSSVINVQCVVPETGTVPLDLSGFGRPVECAFPLVEESGECKIPCPFPVIPVDQQDQIGLAFIIPAIIALIFCLFVFADSCFVIAESQGFNEVLRKQKRWLLFRGGSTNEGEDGSSGNQSGARRRRNVLRAATLYSLLGATLGIIYFCIGPLMTLIRRSEISCGVNAENLDLLQFVLGQAERTDSFCAAQRFAPFVLQMVFNLILYAIVRVFMVVTERSRHMSQNQQRAFDVLLLSYCAGIPLLFLIVASAKDELSTNLADFITQFSRNSAICVMRLSVADEVVLIFMPFIVTGCLICGLSYYIYTHLSIINENVQGIVSSPNKERSSSATALRLLMLRLSVLGVSTFIVLIAFISATGSLMSSMAEFSPRFNNFFLCTATQATTCDDCEAERALMLDKLPPSVAFAAQIAAMSSITLLFGGFFAAQSAARLYKEYQDGTLRIKVANLWHGRRNGGDDGESSFQSFTSPGEGKLTMLNDVVKESCATLFCKRMRRIRDSIRAGGPRGQVFRFGRGNVPKKQPKHKFSVANAWTSSRPVNEKNIQWQGIVGGSPNSPSDPLQWSSSNSNFGENTQNTAHTSTWGGKDPSWAGKDPSWGYSESKLSVAAGTGSVFDQHGSKLKSVFGAEPPGDSATRREQFKSPPKLPQI